MIDLRSIEQRIGRAEVAVRSLQRSSRKPIARRPSPTGGGQLIQFVQLQSNLQAGVSAPADVYSRTGQLKQEGVVATVRESEAGFYFAGRRYAAIKASEGVYTVIQPGAVYVSGVLTENLPPGLSATMEVEPGVEIIVQDQWGDNPPATMAANFQPPEPNYVAIAGDRVGAQWRCRRDPVITNLWEWQVVIHICNEVTDGAP